MIFDNVMGLALFISQALVVTAVAGLIVALYRLRRREKRYNAAIRTLQDDLAALCDGAVGVGDHLNQVEKHLRKLSERQDRADMHDPAFQSLEHAVRMIQNGAAVEEVMSQCGLVRSEAELIITLHRAGRIGVRRPLAAS